MRPEPLENDDRAVREKYDPWNNTLPDGLEGNPYDDRAIREKIEEQREADFYHEVDEFPLDEEARATHKIEGEGIDYEVDQPMGWGIVCTCGWKDTLTNPDAAHAAFERHVEEEGEE